MTDQPGPVRDFPAESVHILPVDGIPEVAKGDPLEEMVVDAVAASVGHLVAGDVVAVTHKIVEDHGGVIDFTSVPGAGTTFRIVLPLTPPAAASADAEIARR